MKIVSITKQNQTNQSKSGVFYNKFSIMMSNDLESIQINGKTYKINCLIGEGGVGVVYHVYNDFGQQYALKMIRNYTKNALLKQSVDSEMKIQQLFKGQKYIINYFGQRVIGNNIYILFELGEFSLRNKIEMNHLVQDQYVQMLIDVAHGLMCVHQKKIIHRDIKPENIIYSKGTFKITDFGTSTQQQTTNEIAGTVIYWAPQLLFDEEQKFTNAVDIWSFGVMAFQAYFLIHPFFYSKANISTKQAINEIKRNIEAITPNFTFGKLINHLKKLGLSQKSDFIDNKLQQTHESLIHLFKSFFVRKPSKRVQVSMLLATLQSIQQDQIMHVQIRESKLLHNVILPPDVGLFVKTLNLFYKLNHDYFYKKHESVEYHFQLGLRLLTITQHKGKDYVAYHHKDTMSQVTVARKQLHQKVRDVLSEYYFYLRETKEIQFFEDLPVLRTLVCLCSCWNIIRDKYKHFLKKVESITDLEMKSMDQFQELMLVFTPRQLASIENLIFSEYFS